MNYEGKHTVQHRGKHAKNNPLIEGKKIICIGAAALVILSAGVITPKVVSTVRENKTVSESIIDNRDSLISVLNNYYRNCNNDTQKVLVGEIISYISETDCSFDLLPEAKNYIFQMYVNDYKNEGFNLVHQEELNDEVYNKVINNSELMGYIKEYSEVYDVPEALLVGFACKNNDYNNNDVLNFNNWISISSSQNVYNFQTKEKNDLLDQTKTCRSTTRMQVKYAAMAFRQALKEANGNLYSPNGLESDKLDELDALDYYIDRKISFRYTNFDKEDIIEHQAMKNRILTAALRYSKDFKTSFSYKFVMNNDYTDDTPTRVCNFMFDNLDEYLVNDFNEIISYVLYLNDNQDVAMNK